MFLVVPTLFTTRILHKLKENPARYKRFRQNSHLRVLDDNKFIYVGCSLFISGMIYWKMTRAINKLSDANNIDSNFTVGKTNFTQEEI